MAELQDKLALQERETSKVTKERNELLQYVKLLEKQIDRQNSDNEPFDRKSFGVEEELEVGLDDGAGQRKYFGQVLEVVQEDKEYDDEEDWRISLK